MARVWGCAGGCATIARRVVTNETFEESVARIVSAARQPPAAWVRFTEWLVDSRWYQEYLEQHHGFPVTGTPPLEFFARLYWRGELPGYFRRQLFLTWSPGRSNWGDRGPRPRLNIWD